MITKIYLETNESGDQKIHCEGRPEELFSLLIDALGKVLYHDLGRDKSVEDIAAFTKEGLIMSLRKYEVEDLIQRDDPRAAQKALELTRDLISGIFDAVGGDGHAMH
jgi:hypothetical protein